MFILLCVHPDARDSEPHPVPPSAFVATAGASSIPYGHSLKRGSLGGRWIGPHPGTASARSIVRLAVARSVALARRIAAWVAGPASTAARPTGLLRRYPGPRLRTTPPRSGEWVAPPAATAEGMARRARPHPRSSVPDWAPRPRTWG